MTSLTIVWMAALVMDLILYGHANTLWWKSKGKSSQSGTADVGSAKNALVRRSALMESGHQEVPGVNLIHRERRQYFQSPVSDQSHPLDNHWNDHGIFNQDTSLCDDILLRSCWSHSDCEGCLGLFTCNLPKGTCHFKGVSSNTGNFFQNMRRDQEYELASK